MSSPQRNKANSVRRYALPVSVGYIGLGAAWILVSDLLLVTLVADPADRSSLQSYKGWFFVAGTGLLLYWLLSRLPERDLVAPAEGIRTTPNSLHWTLLRVSGICLLLIVLLLADFGFKTWSGRNTLIESATDDTRNLARVIEEQTAASINGTAVALGTIDLAITSPDPERGEQEWMKHWIELQMREQLALQPYLRGMLHIDPAGAVLHDAHRGTRPLVALATRDFFRFHQNNPSREIYVGSPFIGEREGEIFTVSRRLSTPSGEFAGVLVAAVSIPYMEQLYGGLETRYGRSITLARHDGTILARVPRLEGAVGRNLGGVLFTDHLPRAAQGTFRTVSTLDGIARILSYRSVSGRSVVVAVGLNEVEVLADWQSQTWRYGGIVAAVILTIVWLGYLLLRELNLRNALRLSLVESEARFQAFMDTSPAIAWIRDEAGRYIYANKAFRENFGSGRDDWTHQTEFDLLLHPAAPDIEVPESSSPGAPVEMLVESTRPDGRRQYWNMIKFLLSNAAGERFVGGIAVDIARQKHAEQALLHSAQHLRELGARLIEVEEAERRAINRELHDRLGQGLATLKLTLSLIHAGLSEDNRKVVGERMDSAQNLVDASIAQVRNVMADLHPPALVDYGLRAALLTCAASLSKGTDTPIVVSGDEVQPRLPAAVELALFRIAQGALTNTLRHAQAAHVELEIINTPEHVVLTISDDGLGFDPAHAGQAKASWGLTIMRERAEAAGLTLNIESQPGQGTRVTVEAARKSI